MALTRIKTDQILDGTITGSDIASGTDISSNNLTLSGDLRGPTTFTIDPAAIGDNTGTVVIAGDLQVDGETTTINSSTLTVDDKQIVIASGATDNTSADGAGILIDGANAEITYDGTNDRFEINKDVNVTGGLDVDSGTLFVDSANNRVGVGTNSPDRNLHINGDVKILNNGGGGKLFIYGDGGTASIDLVAHRDSPLNQNAIRPFGSRGTVDNPADVVSGDSIFTIDPRARVNGEYENHGRMDFVYDGDIYKTDPNITSPYALARFKNTIASAVERDGSVDTAYFSGRLGASINGNRNTNKSTFINFDSYSASQNNTSVTYRFGRETDTTALCRFNFYGHDGQNSSVFQIDNSGNVQLDGSLSKGSGSFRISHPLPEKSETHQLVHSFVESPLADNIYRGTATLTDGAAQVNIDAYVGMTEGTFSALNGNPQIFLQNESGFEPLKGHVVDNILHIQCRDETSTDTISWMVVAERQDQHMLDTQWTDEFGRPVLEPEKSPEPDEELDSDEEGIEE